ncbi:hypothetical protein KQ306_03495 [Synechococcus sp. CS-1324]|uniref:hypothetical protein n=1 Tax=Synechococcus sp. CS-1324 TaxID=2847980 RepID=UPI000DB25EA4|nr:hypothetical protein [Synechococcus sp. CS-1324]MCT0229927.1 hypothetical protein [Synechococcus sp. CS-1324]PZV02446.1 MAG: hypothetical protein DCF23_11595 [Cyanobium sp.]
MTTPHQHTARPRAATNQDLLADLETTMAELQTLRELAIEALTPTVQGMVRGGSRDVQRIEHTLDQLLDHACFPEGLALFKTLCGHYWSLDPQATASYVHAYREMWDADDQNLIHEVAP